MKKFHGDLLMLLSLLAADGAGVYIYGRHFLINVLVTAAVCAVLDLVLTVARAERVEPFDVKGICTGLAIAGMVSPAADLKICLYGAVFAVCVRHITGDIFPGAAAGYIFAELSFPAEVLSYPRPVRLDAAAPDMLIRSGDLAAYRDNASALELLIGRVPGPPAAASAVLIAVCAAALIFSRKASPAVILAGALPVIVSVMQSGAAGAAYLGGMYLYVLVFIIADRDYLPQKKASRLIYGIAVSLLYMMISNISEVSFPIVYAAILAAPFRFMERAEEKAAKTVQEGVE